MTNSQKNLTYPGIDLLRALAASLVLFYHVIALGNWSGLPPGFKMPFAFREGWIGVDLFLVISGFVITLTALNGYEQQGLSFRRDFTRHRLARIVPLYFLTTFVFLLLVNTQLYSELKLKYWLTHLSTHLLFIHNLSYKTHGSINGPAWSVALEMQYYLTMLFLTPLLTRIGITRLLWVSLIGSALWRFLTTLWQVPGVASPIMQFIYQTQLPGVMDEFAMGMVLALLVRHGTGFVAHSLTRGWTHCLGWFALSLLLLAVAAWWMDPYHYWTNTTMLVMYRPLLGAGFAALLASAIAFPAANAKVLAPLRYLGQISYGLYLWHMLVLLTALRLLPSLTDFSLLGYVFFASVLLAAISWHTLEKPNLQHYKIRRLVPAAIS